MNEFTHFDDSGAARMVNVGDKDVTQRYAMASAKVKMSRQTAERVRSGQVHKGDVLQVARLAGIMAAKRTSDLIPLCHPLALESVSVNFDFENDETLVIRAEISITSRTGVEMEALVAASIAALTVYDMCKSSDRAMSVEAVRLEEKSGGRSGHYQAK